MVGTAKPIIGPPMMIFLGSVLKPPQKSITSLKEVPMATSTFLGSAMASPSTVRRLVISGMPVRMYLATNAMEETFMTTQPTSLGSLPSGTILPVHS